MRLFAAIPLSASLIQELAAISTRLHSDGDGFRWSTPESWHITLQFFGSTNRQQYECLVAGFRELRQPPVPIEVEAMGFFDRVGVFYTGIRPTPQLLSLQQTVSAKAWPCGFSPEDRPYRPHITLARSKNKAGTKTVTQLRAKVPSSPSLTGFVANQFVLYESFTVSGGPRYEIRESFPLMGR